MYLLFKSEVNKIKRVLYEHTYTSLLNTEKIRMELFNKYYVYISEQAFFNTGSSHWNFHARSVKATLCRGGRELRGYVIQAILSKSSGTINQLNLSAHPLPPIWAQHIQILWCHYGVYNPEASAFHCVRLHELRTFLISEEGN